MNENTMNKKSFDITITISSDYYEAYISIDILDGDTALTKEDIKSELKKKNISFGIETNTINQICERQESVNTVLIAKGIRHESGVDGKVTFTFDKNLETKPTLNEDGSVDFKNMNFLHIAEKGQVLATRTMPTEGKTGTTVTGKTIPARKGKIVNFKIGKNTVQSEDGLSVLAEVKGNIELSGERISIINVLEIRDDIGVSTGNIDFSGKVIIYGNITTGYSVKSDEEIIVNGIVEGATVISAGDLFINGGIQGQDQAEIIVEGNIVSKFINNAKVICKKNIEADAIMHSIVECDGGIILNGKKSLIVGGDVSVRYQIEAKTIGSEMGTITCLQLGINSEIMEEFQQSQEDLLNLKESITKLSQASRMLRRQYDQTQSADIKAMLDKTETSRTDYTTQVDAAKQNLKRISDLIESLKGAKIKVDTIYPGVRIKISNSHYSVKSAMRHVIIRRTDGEIKAVSM